MSYVAMATCMHLVGDAKHELLGRDLLFTLPVQHLIERKLKD